MFTSLRTYLKYVLFIFFQKRKLIHFSNKIGSEIEMEPNKIMDPGVSVRMQGKSYVYYTVYSIVTNLQNKNPATQAQDAQAKKSALGQHHTRNPRLDGNLGNKMAYSISIFQFVDKRVHCRYGNNSISLTVTVSHCGSFLRWSAKNYYDLRP